MATLTATYSPDDNKLRLYASSRLDADLYKRVHDAGFKWAPKQQLFVAPMWTPEREDLLIELCGEIEDEDKSLVERAEERADRFGTLSSKRADDADRAHQSVAAICEAIPFGQPILVGHHSERRARKDAERIDNGMRQAVRLFETAEYWKQRAAGALRNAQYKELPGVRHRRIKGLEAERRRQERVIAEGEQVLRDWRLSGLPLDQAKLGAHERSLARAGRWLAHFENRITYERAMLDEQGGLKAEGFDIQVGGQVLVRGEWLFVVRVNRKAGRVVSVTTNCRYVAVRGIDEIQDYREASAEQLQHIKATLKTPPLVNFPGEGFAHMTKAQWEKVPKDYRGTTKHAATTTTGAYRVRCALGVYSLPNERDMNKRHSYPSVFITDAKRVDAPATPSGQDA